MMHAAIQPHRGFVSRVHATSRGWYRRWVGWAAGWLALGTLMSASLDYDFKRCGEAVAQARQNTDQPAWWEQAEMIFRDLPEAVAKLPANERGKYQPRLDEWAPQIAAGVCQSRKERLVRKLDDAFKAYAEEVAEKRPAGADRYDEVVERQLADAETLPCFPAELLKKYRQRREELQATYQAEQKAAEFAGILERVGRRADEAEDWVRQYEAIPAADPQGEKRFKRGMAEDEILSAEKTLRAVPSTHPEWKAVDGRLLQLRQRLQLPRPKSTE